MKALFTLALILPLAGCDVASDFWGSSDCGDKMKDVQSSKGKNYTIRNYDSGGYHSEEWTYASKGIAYTFTWGDGIDNCDMSTYRFPAY